MITATLIAVILALVTFGNVLYRISARKDRAIIFFATLSTLPMCWIMFHFVRMPFDAWVSIELRNPDTLLWFKTLYAPLTEEPAKLWLLIFPWVRKKIDGQNIVPFALALGLGFAVGEVITVANLITMNSPQIAALPWYMLGGFITERVMTVAIHSAMTAIALAVWRLGPGLLIGLLVAVTAHFAVNLPISMAQWGWFGKDLFANQILLFSWVLFCTFASLGYLAWLHYGHPSLGRFLFGRAMCPVCGRGYDRPMFHSLGFGVNRRYERCPFCKKWHWTIRREE